jgi:hypothetical protein
MDIAVVMDTVAATVTAGDTAADSAVATVAEFIPESARHAAGLVAAEDSTVTPAADFTAVVVAVGSTAAADTVGADIANT